MVYISANTDGSSSAMWAGMSDIVAGVVEVSTAANAAAPASAVASAAPLMTVTVRFLIDIEVS
jgi:hypothetical protein